MSMRRLSKLRLVAWGLRGSEMSAPKSLACGRHNAEAQVGLTRQGDVAGHIVAEAQVR